MLWKWVVLAAGLFAAKASECLGEVSLSGYGRRVLLSKAVMNVPGQPAGVMEVSESGELVAHMDGRAYFSTKCSAGNRSNHDYIGLKLLGKRLMYTTDLSGTGCNTIAAFYLVSMRQNSLASTCGDYYCDAMSVCGVACPEIDIQEANTHGWLSTLRANSHENAQAGADLPPSEYGLASSCINTNTPIDVAVSFPIDAQGRLQSMDVVLTQPGRECQITKSIGHGYSRLEELTWALEAGMTPVLSYWMSRKMYFVGKDCSSGGDVQPVESVRFYGFSLEDINAGQDPLTAEDFQELHVAGSRPPKFEGSTLPFFG